MAIAFGMCYFFNKIRTDATMFVKAQRNIALAYKVEKSISARFVQPNVVSSQYFWALQHYPH